MRGGSTGSQHGSTIRAEEEGRSIAFTIIIGGRELESSLARCPAQGRSEAAGQIYNDELVFPGR